MYSLTHKWGYYGCRYDGYLIPFRIYYGENMIIHSFLIVRDLRTGYRIAGDFKP